MVTANVELHKLMLSADKLIALPLQERYVFALAGHVFNELMLLQKLVLIAQPPSDAHQFVKDAAVGSAIFALRVLVGKTEEAIKILTKDSVETVLRSRMFSGVEGLDAAWTEVIAKYDTLPWLTSIRNSRSFHYMNSGQWAPHLGKEICQEAYVIVGKTHGNTFFHWHEMSAALPMLKLVNEQAPFEGLAVMLHELGLLLGELSRCIAEGLQAYMHDILTDDDALEDAEVLNLPSMKDTRWGYFYCLKESE